MIDMRDYTPILPCKIALIGDSGVGKSSIISRFVNDDFVVNCLPTLGNCFMSKIVKYEQFKKGIKYDLWDTVGQEKYRAVNRIFYQNAEVVFFVFDITNRNTFDSIEQFWYAEIKDNLSDSLALVLIGNKSDLSDYEEVTIDEAKECAQKMGAIYQSVSAKTNTGIKALFDKIGFKLLKRTGDNEPSLLEKSLSKSKSNLSITLNSTMHSRRKMHGSCCS